MKINLNGIHRISYLLFSLLLTTCLTAQSQTSTTEVKARTGLNVNSSEYAAEEINLGEYGFLFKTASPGWPYKQTVSIYYYDKNIDLKWKKEVESSFYPNSVRNRHDKLIAAIDGSVIYNVQLENKKNLVLQIFNSGDEKKTDLSKYEVSENLQSVFCDARNLYYLTTENGHEKHNKKKTVEKMILHTFSNRDFSYRKTILALPAVEQGENTSFWSYIGQNQTHQFLASKTVNLKTRQCSFQVVAFDSEGKTGPVVKLDLNYPEYELTGLGMIEKGSTVFNLVDLDRIKIYPASNGLSNKAYDVRPTAYSTLRIDPYHDALYAIGGMEAGKKQSYFIHKYNLSGKLIWKGVYPMEQFICFRLTVRPDESLDIAYAHNGGVAVNEISGSGELTNRQNQDFGMKNFFGYDNTIYEGKFFSIYVKGKSTKSLQKINSLSPKEKEMHLFSNYVSSQGELLLISDRKGLVKILQYKY
jgi:hypothetical protein